VDGLSSGCASDAPRRDGLGKTFTIANVIQQVQRPTLVLAHNKTLAAQLYGEFKVFFPKNAVEYFVSYYDTTSPRRSAGIDTFIEKDASVTNTSSKCACRRPRRSWSGRFHHRGDGSAIYGLGDRSLSQHGAHMFAATAWNSASSCEGWPTCSTPAMKSICTRAPTGAGRRDRHLSRGIGSRGAQVRCSTIRSKR